MPVTHGYDPLCAGAGHSAQPKFVGGLAVIRELVSLVHPLLLVVAGSPVPPFPNRRTCTSTAHRGELRIRINGKTGRILLALRIPGIFLQFSCRVSHILGSVGRVAENTGEYEYLTIQGDRDFNSNNHRGVRHVGHLPKERMDSGWVAMRNRIYLNLTTSKHHPETMDRNEKLDYPQSEGYTGGRTLDHSFSVDTQRAFPVYHRKLGNPTPLGLFSFATTILVLSLYNAGARNINVPNVVVAMAMGVGGLCQLLAGMWEYATGRGRPPAFSLYGGFWFSFGLIYWPGSGILAAYEDEKASQLSSALVGVTKAGGILGCITAFLALYTGAAGLYSPDACYFVLPVGDLTRGA
ncbi:GPR1/FUN34/yaaH family domain-containing protein [Rhizoctonia solani AG-1 IA]|uniref:GPR1/FUN34/yaaH family domain-containing protein n=1 Tax=Thanatephorus cucumeris (strain AG1-IA) TaxID=983506 RepID=L8WPA1_THACA|nr:GPR1/FUN34/yaaH family domain-containing protein [Rhizoctonia solani AG-1 IA]